MATMKSYSNNQVCKLLPGTKLLGKWHKKSYKIVKELGSGATGIVYLAETVGGLVALKIGSNSMSITSEVNVLRHFSKVQGQVLGPSLLDVDDFVIHHKTVPFYAMEYLQGEELLTYVNKKGEEWLGIFIVQLLGDLDRLHRAGWAFGDLKPENLLVTGPPPRIRWFDVGGTTQFGRSIKEYTEFYDRGYWGLGTRVAEPSYDLFSVAMMMIQGAYPRRFDKKGDKPLEQLKEAIDAKTMLRPYKPVIMKALLGKYANAQLMKKDLIAAIQKNSKYEHSYQSKKRLTKQKKTKKSSYFVEVMLGSTFLLLAYILYLFGQIL